MNILIVANHYPVCSARYATDAFIRLGHTVKHVGTPMERQIWGMQVPEEYAWTPDEAFIKEQVELIIFMDSDPAVLDLAQKYREGLPKRTPVIVWGVDNHVRDYRRPYFAHYFLAHKSVSVMEWEYREASPSYAPTGMSPMATAHLPAEALLTRQHRDMTWLPCAYDPVAFPPSPIPWNERAYDVCMIGVMYPKRWELVNAMRQAGLKILAGTGLIYDAYRDAYHNSRVALVSSACGDLPIRLFEGMGMGCAVLGDYMADFHLLEKKPAPGMVYTSAQEAVDFAKELNEPGVGVEEHFAELSVEWASSHSWDKRAQVIIDWMEAQS